MYLCIDIRMYAHEVVLFSFLLKPAVCVYEVNQCAKTSLLSQSFVLTI